MPQVSKVFSKDLMSVSLIKKFLLNLETKYIIVLIKGVLNTAKFNKEKGDSVAASLLE